MRTLVRVALICMVGLPLQLAAITLSSPVCGSVVSGAVSMAAAGAPGPTARVVYSMGSYTIGTALAPTFAIDWNTAIAMDGVSAIQVKAEDAMGNLLDSAECLVQISNRHVTLAVTSPDLSETLSGLVSIAVTGSDADAYPAIWMLNIDGEQQAIVWTDNAWRNPNSVTFQLDTTRFANGPHELHISMNSRTGPTNPQWVNWRGMVNRVIQTQNGHVWMESTTCSQNVYLAAGQTAALGCSRLFTDQTAGACVTPSYTSSDETVAMVDAMGTITALKNGFAQVTLNDNGKTATAQVRVSPTSGVPHFAGNGEFLTTYQAGKSLFVTAPFFLDPSFLEQDSGFQNEVVQAGINTLGFGVYSNPRNLTTSYASWQSNYDSTIVPKMQWASDNGFHLLLTGDDMFREIGTDAWYTLNWQAGQQAVQHAVNSLGKSGVGIGIEAIDEASMLWGNTPDPVGMIGQAAYVFDQITCLQGACTVDWPGNVFWPGAQFALQGASAAGLNTPAGAAYTVQNPDANGFQFQAAGLVTGTFSAQSTPTLEFLWYAGNYCAGSSVCGPPVPNNALGLIRGWFPASKTGVPVAFPPLATAPPQVQGNWMGPGSLSDYASHYFTSLKTRTTYPWSEGIQEMVSSMGQEFFGREPYVMQDRPQLTLVSLAGPSYTKGTSSSGVYLPGVDTLSEPGVSPEHVSALMMTAAAMGSAGLRLYYFEPETDLAVRAAAQAGTSYQTGCNPTNLQPASWQAMGFAANLLTSTLQPYLLGQALNSPSFGRNMVTAARAGSDGNMLMIVNGNDWERTIRVSLLPYALGFGATRYVVSATGVATSMLAQGSIEDSITLKMGQTVVYVFGVSAGDAPQKRITLRVPPVR